MAAWHLFRARPKLQVQLGINARLDSASGVTCRYRARLRDVRPMRGRQSEIHRYSPLRLIGEVQAPRRSGEGNLRPAMSPHPGCVPLHLSPRWSREAEERWAPVTGRRALFSVCVGCGTASDPVNWSQALLADASTWQLVRLRPGAQCGVPPCHPTSAVDKNI